jgi:hypothetical protein
MRGRLPSRANLLHLGATWARVVRRQDGTGIHRGAAGYFCWRAAEGERLVQLRKAWLNEVAPS